MVQLRDFIDILYDHHLRTAPGCTSAHIYTCVVLDTHSINGVILDTASLQTRLVHSMGSTRDQHVSSLITFELAIDDREKWLQHRRERERACRESETAEQREGQLRKQ